MNKNETKRIGRIARTVHDLLNGHNPEPIDLDGQEDDEIRQLSNFINCLLKETTSVAQATLDLSNGNISSPIKSKLSFAHSLKDLQSRLRHLTWQTGLIAEGDFTQRTDFPGEFSESFNRMVQQLGINRKDFETLVNEHTKELSILLDTTIKTSQTLDLKEIFQIFSEMLIKSFKCHTHCRVAIMDKRKEKFEIKHAISIRPLNVNTTIGEVFSLKDLNLIRKTLKDYIIRIISIDNDHLNEKEKELLFQNHFKSVLIIPFKYGRETLGFALLCEARDSNRVHFPMDHVEFYKTLANHLGISINNAQLFAKNKNIFLHTITALAAAIDARDSYTHFHSRNVTKYSVRIAEEMNLPADQIADLRTAGLLHDIGKIGIRDKILLKPGKLTECEFNIIKTHPQKAVKILKAVEGMENIIEIIASHHERYDGKGYPMGLKGETIHLGARIIAVADTFDAMTTSRVYREASKREEAIERIKECSGTQLDAQVVKAFLKIAPSLPKAGEFGENSLA